MEYIAPVTWSNSMLTSHNTVDTDVALWLVGTAYTVGQQARLDTTHTIYQCLIANTGQSPDINTSGATPKWGIVSATNSYKMFDNKYSTRTTASLSMVQEITPGAAVDALAFLNCIGQQIHVIGKVAGVTKYEATVTLESSTGVYDWYTYFFAPIIQNTEVILTGIPPYVGMVFTVTTTGSSTVGIGNFSMGNLVSLGALEYNPTVGITDYSKKETDTYGNIIVTERPFSKKMGGRFVIDDMFVDSVVAALTAVRTIPVVWIGARGKNCLVVFGFYKDFEVDIAYPTMSYCTITIEGLT